MRRMYSENQLKELSREEAKLVKKDISTLIDKDGHPRFIEGSIETVETTGITFSYAKWSLSGTHLMIVLAGTMENGATITGANLGAINLPAYILSKIVSVFSNVVELQTITARDTSWSSQTFLSSLRKDVDGLKITNETGSLTLSSEKSFRISYDLLIDNE